MNTNSSPICVEVDSLFSLIENSERSFHSFSGTLKNRSVSSITLEEYRRTYINLKSRVDIENAIFIDDLILQTNSKNTYYKRIAACQQMILRLVENEFELARWAALEEDSDSLHAHLHQIECLKYELLQIRSLNGACRIKRRQNRRSKRTSLSGLPPKWREQLFERMQNSKYALGMLLLAIVGCRPSELCLGITVKKVVQSDQDLLCISIVGAKTNEANGQPIRQLLFSYAHKSFLLNVLKSQLENAGGLLIVRVENKKAFSNSITRFGRLIWPEHKHDVTPYTFRHAFASDMKANFDSETIARSLGHVSARTQKGYGQRQLSKIGEPNLPIAVQASRLIRNLKNTYSCKINVPMVGIGD